MLTKQWLTKLTFALTCPSMKVCQSYSSSGGVPFRFSYVMKFQRDTVAYAGFFNGGLQ